MNMRGPGLLLLGVASHASCLYSPSSAGGSLPSGNDLGADTSNEGQRSIISSIATKTHSWLLIRGGTQGEHPIKTRFSDHSVAEFPGSWWRARRRRAAPEAASTSEETGGFIGYLQGRPHILLSSIIRKLRRWFRVIVDITTLKSLRQLRQARKGILHYEGSTALRYRRLIEELQAEIAAKPGLERRAKRVNHELDSITLARFLEAAFWSLEHDGGKRVSEFIENTIAWRESIGAHCIRKEDVAMLGAKGTIFVKGHDLHRHPVVYFRPALGGKLLDNGNTKLMIYSLERAIRLMPRGCWQYTIVIDCEGMGLGHLPPLNFMKGMFELLGHHYPMRLGPTLFMNVGPSVMLCWRVVSPLLQKRTKKKMFLLPSTKLSVAFDYISPDQLLSFVGGESSWLFNSEAYFSSDAASS